MRKLNLPCLFFRNCGLLKSKCTPKIISRLAKLIAPVSIVHGHKFLNHSMNLSPEITEETVSCKIYSIVSSTRNNFISHHILLNLQKQSKNKKLKDREIHSVYNQISKARYLKDLAPIKAKYQESQHFTQRNVQKQVFKHPANLTLRLITTGLQTKQFGTGLKNTSDLY